MSSIVSQSTIVILKYTHSQFVLFPMSTATYGQISKSSIIKSVNVVLENGFSNHKNTVV